MTGAVEVAGDFSTQRKLRSTIEVAGDFSTQRKLRSTIVDELISLSDACDSMVKLKRIHTCLFRSCLHYQLSTLILAKLLRFAAVSPRGDLRYATLLFRYHANPNIISAFFYNTLIRGFANSSDPAQSLLLFSSMRRTAIAPDPFSFTFILKARARCNSKMRMRALGDIHAEAIKFGCLGSHPSHVHVHNALIHLYVPIDPDAARRVFDEMPSPDVVSWSGLLAAHLKASDLDAARRVFDQMPERDVVSWTAMISGYAQARRPRDALKLFRSIPVQPDEVTMVGVISACTALADLQAGENVHRLIDEKGFGWMVSLRNALIDMYAKCGCLEKAREVFDGTENKSLITWNSMISAYAAHGDTDAASSLFQQMAEASVKADGATFLAVLGACAHQGRVAEGRRVFEVMLESGVQARVEHYGCMVDMLGRAGLLEEAFELTESMPIPSNDIVWGALLGSCRIHGNAEMAEVAAKKLMQLKPGEGGYYVLLSSIYAASNQQEEAAKVRQAMRERIARKNPGVSSSWPIATAT